MSVFDQYWILYLYYLINSICCLIDRDTYFVLTPQVKNALVFNFLLKIHRRRHPWHISGKWESKIEDMSPYSNTPKLCKHLALSQKFVFVSLHMVTFIRASSKRHIFEWFSSVKRNNDNAWSRKRFAQVENNLSCNILSCWCEESFAWNYTQIIESPFFGSW